jgi:hypothetical protein
VKLRIKWVGQVARLGEMRTLYNVLVGKSEGKSDHLEDLCIDGKIILKYISGT